MARLTLPYDSGSLSHLIPNPEGERKVFVCLWEGKVQAHTLAEREEVNTEWLPPTARH